jgi:hypothetical protein
MGVLSYTSNMMNQNLSDDSFWRYGGPPPQAAQAPAQFRQAPQPPQAFAPPAAPGSAQAPAAMLSRSGQPFAGAGAVAGPGDGREDLIDAKLSDGEYVFDAETVSLLGNGSTEAGARQLDNLRQRIRAHKGEELSKGKFSPDALAPEEYL